MRASIIALTGLLFSPLPVLAQNKCEGVHSQVYVVRGSMEELVAKLQSLEDPDKPMVANIHIRQAAMGNKDLFDLQDLAANQVVSTTLYSEYGGFRLQVSGPVLSLQQYVMGLSGLFSPEVLRWVKKETTGRVERQEKAKDVEANPVVPVAKTEMKSETAKENDRLQISYENNLDFSAYRTTEADFKSYLRTALRWALPEGKDWSVPYQPLGQRNTLLVRFRDESPNDRDIRIRVLAISNSSREEERDFWGRAATYHSMNYLEVPLQKQLLLAEGAEVSMVGISPGVVMRILVKNRMSMKEISDVLQNLLRPKRGREETFGERVTFGGNTYNVILDARTPGMAKLIDLVKLR